MTGKGFLENDVKRTDDIRDDRLGRVIDATPFTFLWIVLGKECLIEVKNRVASFAFSEILMKDFLYISDGKNFSDVINGSLKLSGWVNGRDEAKNITQNANGLRYEFVCKGTSESAVGSGVKDGRKSLSAMVSNPSERWHLHNNREFFAIPSRNLAAGDHEIREIASFTISRHSRSKMSWCQ